MAKKKRLFNKLSNWFTEVFADIFGNEEIATQISSWLNSQTGAHMTNASKENMDYSFDQQQQLNEQEYIRKREFYEDYESYAAQVRQMGEAGLNPALMYGNGASVSASGGIGSAGSAHPADVGGVGSLSNIIASIAGVVQRNKERKQEKAIADEQNRIRLYEAETHRVEAQNYGAYLTELTRGKQYENDTFFEMFGLKADEIEANIGLKNQQKEYFIQVANSESVRRQLMQSGIRLNDAETACATVQKAILEAQEKYSDKYFKAVADFQTANASIAGVEADIVDKTQVERLDAAKAELADLIIRAGMDAKIFMGEAFQRSVEGEMTKKDWTQTVSKIVTSLIAGGAVVGATAIRGAARGVVPPGMTWTSSQQYRFYNATGYRYDTSM